MVIKHKRAMALVPLAVTAVALLSPRAQTRKAPTFASRRQNGPLCSVNAEPQMPRANVTTDVDVEGASEAIRALLWHDSGFESIDADNDGSITREEFTDAMAKRAAQEFESIDTSNDGSISREEFSDAMAKRGALERPAFISLDGSTFLTRNAGPLVAFYLGFSTVFFHLVEGWTWGKAFHFCCVTLTTIGYGDVTPVTDTGKAGACAFILLGLSIAATALGHLVGSVTSAAGVGSQRASVARETRLLAAVVLGGAGFVHVSEGWSPLDSLYWAIVTGSSVGYGDLVPIQPTTQIFTNVYLLVGVGAFAASIGRYAAAMAEEEEQRQLQAFVARGVSQELIDAVDTDGDGTVERQEFVEYCLLALGKVSHLKTLYLTLTQTLTLTLNLTLTLTLTR